MTDEFPRRLFFNTRNSVQRQNPLNGTNRKADADSELPVTNDQPISPHTTIGVYVSCWDAIRADSDASGLHFYDDTWAALYTHYEPDYGPRYELHYDPLYMPSYAVMHAGPTHSPPSSSDTPTSDS
jgi:hypothetical protein